MKEKPPVDPLAARFPRVFMIGRNAAAVGMRLKDCPYIDPPLMTAWHKGYLQWHHDNTPLVPETTTAAGTTPGSPAT